MDKYTPESLGYTPRWKTEQQQSDYRQLQRVARSLRNSLMAVMRDYSRLRARNLPASASYRKAQKSLSRAKDYL